MLTVKDQMELDEKKRVVDALRGIQYIVINTDYGGFGLSEEAQDLYAELVGGVPDNWYDRDVARDDPYLIQVVRILKEKAGGRFSKLKIVEVPAGVEWQIDEYDGKEWVAEKHRTWR